LLSEVMKSALRYARVEVGVALQVIAVVGVEREDDAAVEALHQLLHRQVVDPHVEQAGAGPGPFGRQLGASGRVISRACADVRRDSAAGGSGQGPLELRNFTVRGR
jgi:hypothetical protein